MVLAPPGISLATDPEGGARRALRVRRGIPLEQATASYPPGSPRAPALLGCPGAVRQLRVSSPLRDMRRQPLDGVVPHDVVGPAFELSDRG